MICLKCGERFDKRSELIDQVALGMCGKCVKCCGGKHPNNKLQKKVDSEHNKK